MLRASVRNRLLGRTSFLVLAVLVLGGFFTFLAPGSAQNPTTKQPTKGPADPKTPPKATTDILKDEPKPIKLELHKGIGQDVAEAVRIINEQLTEGWKKNKVTPSRQATDAEF